MGSTGPGTPCNRLGVSPLLQEGQQLWRGGAAGGPRPAERLAGAAGPAAGRDVLSALPLAPGLLPAALPAAGRQQALTARPRNKQDRTLTGRGLLLPSVPSAGWGASADICGPRGKPSSPPLFFLFPFPPLSPQHAFLLGCVLSVRVCGWILGQGLFAGLALTGLGLGTGTGRN